MNKYYSITELTREFGISTRTLRFYEDEGLIHPERRGRTRLFRPADRHLIKEILRGRRIGFTIAEIREIIQVYKDPPGEMGQLQLLIKRVEEKREDLRQKRKDIEDTLSELTMSKRPASRVLPKSVSAPDGPFEFLPIRFASQCNQRKTARIIPRERRVPPPKTPPFLRVT